MFTGLIPCVTIFQADMYLMQTQRLSLNHVSALERTNEMRRFMGLAHVFVCLPFRLNAIFNDKSFNIDCYFDYKIFKYIHNKKVDMTVLPNDNL